MFKVISGFSWIVVLFTAAIMLVMVSLLVLTSGGIDVLGLHDKAVSTPISVGPAPSQNENPSITGPAPLNSVLPKRLIFANIPLPQEISRRPQVIGTNLILAIILALAIGTMTSILNNLFRDRGGTFHNWFVNVLSRGSKRGVQRGCLGLPIIMLIFALYGIIFATLESGTSILSPDGIQLAIVMAMSVGLISLGGDIAQRWMARLWHIKPQYGLYPGNLLIAIGTTVFSRVVHLSPGIIYGVPGDADIDLSIDKKQNREIILAFTTLITILVLGILGWAATGIIAQLGTQTLNADILTFWGPIIRLAQTFGLAIFVVAVQTLFLTMFPLSASIGSKLFSWSAIVWTLVYLPIVFIFAHTILNPNGDFITAVQSANVRVTFFLMAGLVLFTLMLWFYVRLVLPRFRRRVPIPEFAAEDTKPTGAYSIEQAPTMLTLKIKIPMYEAQDEEAKSDTRPGPAVQIQEPAVTDEDTKPRPAVDDDVPEPAYFDPRTYHYDDLFPPAKPGDEDFLESTFPEEDTPASGDTPLEDNPGKPKPPDSLPP